MHRPGRRRRTAKPLVRQHARERLLPGDLRHERHQGVVGVREPALQGRVPQPRRVRDALTEVGPRLRIRPLGLVVRGHGVVQSPQMVGARAAARLAQRPAHQVIDEALQHLSPHGHPDGVARRRDLVQGSGLRRPHPRLRPERRGQAGGQRPGQGLEGGRRGLGHPVALQGQGQPHRALRLPQVQDAGQRLGVGRQAEEILVEGEGEEVAPGQPRPHGPLTPGRQLQPHGLLELRRHTDGERGVAGLGEGAAKRAVVGAARGRRARLAGPDEVRQVPPARQQHRRRVRPDHPPAAGQRHHGARQPGNAFGRGGVRGEGRGGRLAGECQGEAQPHPLRPPGLVVRHLGRERHLPHVLLRVQGDRQQPAQPPVQAGPRVGEADPEERIGELRKADAGGQVGVGRDVRQGVGLQTQPRGDLGDGRGRGGARNRGEGGAGGDGQDAQAHSHTVS